MGTFRPSALALIITLSLVTSGVATVQSVDAERGILDAGSAAIEEAQRNIQQEENTVQSSASLSTASKFDLTCPDGTVFLAKYEIVDSDDDGTEETFVLEEGSDAFSFSNKMFDDDGVIRYTWESTNPYVTYIKSQYNGKLYEADYDPAVRGTSVPEQKQAYSNVVFCAPRTYQVDLISGDPAGTLTEDNLYRPQDRLIRAAYVTPAGNVFDRGGQNSPAARCLTIDEDITVDGNTETVSVTFTVDDRAACDGLRISLAAYETPGTGTGFGLPQELADHQTVIVRQGEKVTLETELKDTGN